MLKEEQVGAIGRFVLAGKEKLCLIRPKGDALVLETLFVAEDVYSQAEIDEAAEEATAPKKAAARPRPAARREPRRATSSRRAADERVPPGSAGLLEAKLAGQPLVEPEPEPRTRR